MRLYDAFFNQVLTRADPERAHHLAFRAIRAAHPVAGRAIPRRDPGEQERPPVRAMGLTFPHPLGLAAGFDKNGLGIDALAALGFGHVEIGTVTAEPQPGNPGPRLFRLPADRAIVNRMGFNNEGAVAVAARLAARAGRMARLAEPHAVVVGVNIGKTKVVPEDDKAAVHRDYEKSAGLLAPYADYLVVNVSSPNTPGLRSLQAVERLGPLLEAVRRRADEVTPPHRQRIPLLVKIAPDLDDPELYAVADLALELGIDGLIATNTTTSRAGLVSDPREVDRVGPGGLSGPPLAQRSCEVLRILRKALGDQLTLVSVGGVSTADDARERLTAGATLVQAYTGFVYGGPLWPRRVARGLVPTPPRGSTP